MEARRFTDRAGVDDLLESLQRLVEQEVLHDAEHPLIALRGVEHAIRVCKRARHRLLHVHMEARVEDLLDDRRVARGRRQDLDDVEVLREEVVEVGVAGCVGPFRGPVVELCRVRVAEGDDLRVRVVAIAGDRQVVDASESEDADTQGPVVRHEVHRPIMPDAAVSHRPSGG